MRIGARSMSALLGLGLMVACQRRGAEASREAPAPAVAAPAVAAPAAPAPAAPAAPAVAAPAAPAAQPEAQHIAAYQHPLLFHYAHIGGRGTADATGMLHHDDGQYFELGPGDSLTLEVDQGRQLLSDGTPAVGDLEVVVHPHVGETRVYEVDVSFDHLDRDGAWTMLSTAGGHEIDLDHAGIAAARYVRIRNNDPQRSVYLDAVYARTVQPCTNPARCSRVVHRVAPQR